MSNIEVIALRSFLWSEDGYTEKQAAEKQVFDLPERLFDGLNKSGHVRRAVIGDGHVSLQTVDHKQYAKLSKAAAEIIGNQIRFNAFLSGANEPATEIDDTPEAPPAEVGTQETPPPAPRPASATAPLSDEEEAALKDGSWKSWRFFKQRSVAAKISTEPVSSSEDVIPVLEAKAAELAGE